MTGRAPGTLRVVALLAGVSLKRTWNRMRARKLARKKKDGDARTGTARKGGRSYIGLAFMAAIFLLQGFLMSYNYTYLVVDHVESRAWPEGEAPPLKFAESRVWVERAPVEEVLRPFAVVFTILILAILLLGLGTSNAELSQVGWSMEWLFTFPVPTRGLLLAKVGEYGLTSIFSWLTVFPLSSVVLWSAGWGAWGLLAGGIATLFVALSIASVRVLIETFLRKNFALHRVKNFQALCTLFGTLFLFAIFGLMARAASPDLLFDVSDVIGGALLYAPTGAIVQLAASAGGGLTLLGWSVLTIGLCLGAAEAMIADGLVSAGGPYQGERRGRRSSRRSVGGILGKDLLLLLRDRNFMMQTIFLPILIVAFQLVVNPTLMASGSGRGVAVLAFGVGAYVLINGGLSVLTAERNALWLLFSLPQRLDRLFLRKALLWVGLAVAYAVAILSIGWRPEGEMEAVAWLAPLFAVCGVALHGFLAGAMGVLGSDPFETELHKKFRPEWGLLYMLVAGNYGMTLANGDLWTVIVLHVVLAFLVFSMWDRVRARLPYLLDPDAQPVRRIEASDGLMATFLFFCLQQMILMAAVGLGAPPTIATTFAYGVAGFVTLAAVFYVFWRRGVTRVVRDLGLVVPGVGKLLVGVLAGVVVGSVAALYLRYVPAAGQAMERGQEYLREHPEWRTATVVIAVGLAPVIEEFLFRGLLFRGLQRTMRPAFAVAGSALLFAVVHPPISVLPVFGLGIATALVFSRTRMIWAAIATHATYNAIVMLMTLPA